MLHEQNILTIPMPSLLNQLLDHPGKKNQNVAFKRHLRKAMALGLPQEGGNSVARPFQLSSHPHSNVTQWSQRRRGGHFKPILACFWHLSMQARASTSRSLKSLDSWETEQRNVSGIQKTGLETKV